VDAAALREAALDAGLDAVGFADAAPFLDARRALVERKAAGLHAGMGFTYNKPERSTDPALAMPGARSLVVGAVAYPHATPPPPPGRGPCARVGAYARIDHYARLRDGLREVAASLKAGGYRARVVVDDNALVDRPAAHRAGLGWFGKSSNLLHPEWGSWMVVGSVVTTADLPATPGPLDDGCGSCRRCLDGCPTGAIVAPGVVDARRCLSWLLQQPGEFPRHLRAAVGDRIYGCDDCQEVCPPSRRAAEVDRSVPVVVCQGPTGDGAWVPVLELLAMDDDAVLDRHGRWYIAGRDVRWVRRNALLVLGNSGQGTDPAVVDAVRRHLDHVDPVLRHHAAWAARRLDRHDLLAGHEHDPAVAAELAESPPAPAAGRPEAVR
jgi:epoxyqueuosine reductase